MRFLPEILEKSRHFRGLSAKYYMIIETHAFRLQYSNPRKPRLLNCHHRPPTPLLHHRRECYPIVCFGSHNLLHFTFSNKYIPSPLGFAATYSECRCTCTREQPRVLHTSIILVIYLPVYCSNPNPSSLHLRNLHDPSMSSQGAHTSLLSKDARRQVKPLS